MAWWMSWLYMLVLGRALLKGVLFENVYLTFEYVCFALYLCHVWNDFVDLI